MTFYELTSRLFVLKQLEAFQPYHFLCLKHFCFNFFIRINERFFLHFFKKKNNVKDLVFFLKLTLTFDFVELQICKYDVI